LLQPEYSQVVSLELTPASTALHATLRTQRERGTSFFAFERAPNEGGAPGAWAGIDSVPAAGDSSLATSDRTEYPRTWSVPADEYGASFWYRIAWTEDGVRRASPARRVTSPIGPPAATIEYTVVHDAYDHDVTGAISAASGAGSVTLPLPGTSA